LRGEGFLNRFHPFGFEVVCRDCAHDEFLINITHSIVNRTIKSTINHFKTLLWREPVTFGSMGGVEDRKGANFYQLAIAHAAMRGLAEAES
jgi:hypothetical protein